MTKPTLDDAISIGDPLLSDNYELSFPQLPDGINAGEALRIQCRTATKPGMTIEEVLIEVFGHTVRHAGKNTVTGSMSAEFAENSEMAIYKPLEQWVNYCRDHESQLGNFKADYAVTGTFRIFKQDGSEAAVYEIFGVWPKTVPDLSFDGSSSQALPVAVEFSFDYYKEVA
tara:strand:+ start:73442 stop:73954 length:513 start_codon:yes stop_codon:yes gene_type:complete